MKTLKSQKHLNGFTLLPAKKGSCPHCATEHEPEQPHNQQSLYYQYAFYGENGRWPSWTDAMAHCTDEVKHHWIKGLKENGVTVLT